MKMKRSRDAGAVSGSITNKAVKGQATSRPGTGVAAAGKEVQNARAANSKATMRGDDDLLDGNFATEDVGSDDEVAADMLEGDADSSSEDEGNDGGEFIAAASDDEGDDLDDDLDNAAGASNPAGPAVSSSSAAADPAAAATKSEAKRAKKKKQLAKLKEKKAAEAAAARSGAMSLSSALMSEDGATQAGAFWRAFSTSGAAKSLTELELAQELQAHHVAAIPTSLRATDARSDSDLVPAVKACLPGWKQVFGYLPSPHSGPRPKGSPAVLIVCPSARRAADLLKPLAAFKTRIGKCFAKHLKEHEQVAMLQTGPPITIAVGTPHRLNRLCDIGALSLSSCALVLFDCHPDQKGYSILDAFATKEDAFTFYKQHLHERVHAGSSSSSSGGTGGGKATAARLAFY